MAKLIERAAFALVLAAAAYTVHRALVLRIEYWDGYAYLNNAKRLLGDPIASYTDIRPPLVALLQMPAVALARLGAPANIGYLVWPHLLSAILSLLTLAALYAALRGALSRPLALVGVALFACTRLFIRYGAHAMADIPSAGAATAAVALYIRARAGTRWPLYGWCGVAVGAAALAKYPMAVMGPTLVVAELLHVVHGRRIDLKRWAGLTLTGAAAIATFVAAQAWILRRVSGRVALLDYFVGLMRSGATIAAAGLPWTNYREMALVMISVPTLLLAVAGIAVVAREREERDLPFVAWLGVVAYTTVFIVRYQEARYLVPVVPPLVYFAARAIERAVDAAQARLRARRPIALALAALLVLAAGSGVAQARADRDPVFLHDAQHRAAALMLARRLPPGVLEWIGSFGHTFHPKDALLLHSDQYFNTFHFPSFAAEYYVGEPLRQTGFGPDWAALTLDGSVILRVSDAFWHNQDLPPGGVPPPEVWAVRRLVMVHAGSTRFVGQGNPETLEVHEEGGQLVLRAPRDLGSWDVWLAAPPSWASRQIAGGPHALRAGVDVPLGPGKLDEVAGLLLFQFDKTILN